MVRLYQGSHYQEAYYLPRLFARLSGKESEGDLKGTPLLILPLPPFQQFRVMLVMGGVVDDTTEDVEHAAINMSALIGAEFEVEFFGVLVFQILKGTQTEGMSLLWRVLPVVLFVVCDIVLEER
jgi:hypothetical protein